MDILNIYWIFIYPESIKQCGEDAFIPSQVVLCKRWFFICQYILILYVDDRWNTQCQKWSKIGEIVFFKFCC